MQASRTGASGLLPLAVLVAHGALHQLAVGLVVEVLDSLQVALQLPDRLLLLLAVRARHCSCILSFLHCLFLLVVCVWFLLLLRLGWRSHAWGVLGAQRVGGRRRR